MPRKQSYESHPEVQRWLSAQAREYDLTPDSFQPTFLASRRDGDWILSSLAVFYQQHLIVDVLSQASSGKEATVYCCLAHPDAGGGLLAAKVYRPRMFRSLRNDAIYRDGRTQRDERGRPVHDERGGRGARGAGAGARPMRADPGIRHEYAIQQRIAAAGAAVPQPISQIGNAVLMEYIGDGDGPAPRLSDLRPAPAEAHELFESLLVDLAIMLGQDVIHGDLSAYNILYHQGDAIVIDFAQAVNPRRSDAAYALLERDVDRLCRYFGRAGVRADAAALTADLWSRYLAGQLSDLEDR